MSDSIPYTGNCRKSIYSACLLIIPFLLTAPTFDAGAQDRGPEEEWISLFDGHTLKGWKAGGNPGTFTVRDSAIVADGPRAHLFYTGDNGTPAFRDFEFRVEVKTTEEANSGIYFHTRYQREGWPSEGFEVQINNSYPHDHRRTGSLYGVDDITEAPAPDNEWFTVAIRVKGRRVTVTVNGRTLVDHRVRPAEERPGDGRELSAGTFALQAHDPDSEVRFRNIRVKTL